MKTTHHSKVSLKPMLANSIAILTGCILLLPMVSQADAKKAFFTGTEVYTGAEPGTQFTDGVTGFVTGFHFHALEQMSDARVSGESIVGWNAIIDLASFTGPQWGSFRLDNAGGAWDGYWQGTITSADGHLTDHLVCTAVGSGGYEGLVARWTYEGKDWSQGSPLTATGYIVEAKGGPADLPLLGIGSRVDLIQIVPGVFLNPVKPSEVIGEGVLGRTSTEGVAWLSHAGRCQEEGGGIFNPATGAVTAIGTETAANGDLIYWVAEGTSTISADGKTAVFDGTAHVAGGTGRFEAATGVLDCNFIETLEPTADEMVFRAKYPYRVQGTIRYANSNPKSVAVPQDD